VRRRTLIVAAGLTGFVGLGTGLADSGSLARPISLRSPAAAQLYAIDFAVKGGRVVRFDPATLRARPGRGVPVLDSVMGWSFSPDRRRLVLGDQYGRIRIVDTVRMRQVARMDTGVGGAVIATHWLPPVRLLVVVETNLVVIDPAAGRIVARRALGSSPVAVARTPTALVLLLRPSASGIGESTLAVVGREGDVRTVRLPEIQSGMDEIDHEAAGLYRQASPGLTVDPVGNRAFVVAADAPVAAVDLATLKVSYHSFAEPVSILGRVHDWVEPLAEAKGAAVGPRRAALWLGDGRIAVWGTDDNGRLDAEGHGQQFQEPAGLMVIDTRDWTVRHLDRGASEAVVANGLILASASLWSSTEQRARGMGLAAYGPDGSRRFHVLGSEPAWDVQIVGERAIVPRQDAAGAVSYVVVDLADGRIDAVLRPRTSFMLLNGTASRWIG
jgi:hypothetical protein